MLVPETAVHEYELSVPCEYEIGTARQIARMQAVAAAHREHHLAYRDLGARVLCPDAAHDFGAVLLAQDVQAAAPIARQAHEPRRRDPAAQSLGYELHRLS